MILSKINRLKAKKTDLVPADCDYVHFPFHVTSGTDVPYEGRLNNTDFSGNATLERTLGAIWTNLPYWASPENNNYIDVGGVSQIVDIMTPDATRKGGILLIHKGRIDSGRTPDSSADRYIQFGNQSTGGEGGYFMGYTNNTNGTFVCRVRGTDDSEDIVAKNWMAANEDTDLVFWAYIDLVSGVHTVAIGADFNDASTISLDPSLLPAELDDDYTITLLAGHGSGGNDNSNLNSGSYNSHVRDIWVISSPDGLSNAEIADILSKFDAQSFAGNERR